MKKIIILAIIIMLLTLACTAQEKSKTTSNESLNWLTNLQEAQKIAKQKDLPIFVNFTGSDWCQWCFRLRDEVFVQPEFINYAKESLVLLELDFPRSSSQSDAVKRYNQNLMNKYSVRGFPTILLLDANANEIGRTGYQRGGAANYVQHLKKMILSGDPDASLFDTKDFTLPDLNNNQFTLSKSTGVIILDFWATWCQPCKAEIPYLQNLYEKYGNSGLTIVGISNEPVEKQIEFNKTMKNNGTEITYLQLVDKTSQTFRDFGIQSIPATFIISPDGKLLKKEVGFTPDVLPEFEKLIEENLPK